MIKYLFLFYFLTSTVYATKHLKAGIRHASNHIHVVSDLNEITKIEIHNKASTKLLEFNIATNGAYQDCNDKTAPTTTDSSVDIHLVYCTGTNENIVRLYDVEIDVSTDHQHIYIAKLFGDGDKVTSERLLSDCQSGEFKATGGTCETCTCQSGEYQTCDGKTTAQTCEECTCMAGKAYDEDKCNSDWVNTDDEEKCKQCECSVPGYHFDDVAACPGDTSYQNWLSLNRHIQCQACVCPEGSKLKDPGNNNICGNLFDQHELYGQDTFNYTNIKDLICEPCQCSQGEYIQTSKCKNAVTHQCDNTAYTTSRACLTQGTWGSQCSASGSVLDGGRGTSETICEANAFSWIGKCDVATYTTQTACTNQGTWITQECSVNEGGREIDQAKCQAAASTWTDGVCKTGGIANGYQTQASCEAVTGNTWTAASCVNEQYTTKTACTTVGSWNDITPKCSIDEGGRGTNETICEADASVWTNKCYDDSTVKSDYTTEAGCTTQGTWNHPCAGDDTLTTKTTCTNAGTCADSNGVVGNGATHTTATACNAANVCGTDSETQCVFTAHTWTTYCNINEGGREESKAACIAEAAIWSHVIPVDPEDITGSQVCQTCSCGSGEYIDCDGTGEAQVCQDCECDNNDWIDYTGFEKLIKNSEDRGNPGTHCDGKDIGKTYTCETRTVIDKCFSGANTGVELEAVSDPYDSKCVQLNRSEKCSSGTPDCIGHCEGDNNDCPHMYGYAKLDTDASLTSVTIEKNANDVASTWNKATHGLTVGDYIDVSECFITTVNKQFKIASITSDTFTVSEIDSDVGFEHSSDDECKFTKVCNKKEPQCIKWNGVLTENFNEYKTIPTSGDVCTLLRVDSNFALTSECCNDATKSCDAATDETLNNVCLATETCTVESNSCICVSGNEHEKGTYQSFQCENNQLKSGLVCGDLIAVDGDRKVLIWNQDKTNTRANRKKRNELTVENTIHPNIRDVLNFDGNVYYSGLRRFNWDISKVWPNVYDMDRNNDMVAFALFEQIIISDTVGDINKYELDAQDGYNVLGIKIIDSNTVLALIQNEYKDYDDDSKIAPFFEKITTGDNWGSGTLTEYHFIGKQNEDNTHNAVSGVKYLDITLEQSFDIDKINEHVVLGLGKVNAVGEFCKNRLTGEEVTTVAAGVITISGATAAGKYTTAAGTGFITSYTVGDIVTIASCSASTQNNGVFKISVIDNTNDITLVNVATDAAIVTGTEVTGCTIAKVCVDSGLCYGESTQCSLITTKAACDLKDGSDSSDDDADFNEGFCSTLGSGRGASKEACEASPGVWDSSACTPNTYGSIDECLTQGTWSTCESWQSYNKLVSATSKKIDEGRIAVWSYARNSDCPRLLHSDGASDAGCEPIYVHSTTHPVRSILYTRDFILYTQNDKLYRIDKRLTTSSELYDSNGNILKLAFNRAKDKLSLSTDTGEVLSFDYDDSMSTLTPYFEYDESTRISALSYVYDPSPQVSTAILDATSLTITFDESIDTGTPNIADFTVKVDSTVSTIQTATLSSGIVTLTLAATATADKSVTVSYAKSDTSGNNIGDGSYKVESFEDYLVHVVPTPIKFEVTAAKTVKITMNGDVLATACAPAQFAFTGTNSETAAACSVSGSVITLTTATSITASSTVNVAYAKGDGVDNTKLQTFFDADIADWSATTVVVIPIVSSTVVTAANTVVITMNADVVATACAPAQFAFTGWATEAAAACIVSDNTITLTTTTKITSDSNVNVAYTRSGNDETQIQNQAGFNIADFAAQSVSNTIVSSVTSIETTSENTIVITTDGKISTDCATSLFVLKDMTINACTIVCITTSCTITLTTATVMTAADDLQLTFTNPTGTDQIKSTTNNQPIVDFVAIVTNNVLPVVISISGGKTTSLVIEMNGNVQSTNCDIGQFSPYIIMEYLSSSSTSTKKTVCPSNGICVQGASIVTGLTKDSNDINDLSCSTNTNGGNVDAGTYYDLSSAVECAHAAGEALEVIPTEWENYPSGCFLYQSKYYYASSAGSGNTGFNNQVTGLCKTKTCTANADGACWPTGGASTVAAESFDSSSTTATSSFDLEGDWVSTTLSAPTEFDTYTTTSGIVFTVSCSDTDYTTLNTCTNVGEWTDITACSVSGSTITLSTEENDGFFVQYANDSPLIPNEHIRGETSGKEIANFGPYYSVTWTSAATTSLVSGAAPGNLVFTLGITTALANTDTLDITASQAIWSAAAATTCTATIGGTATTAFTTAATSTSILRVTATGAIATGTFVLTCTDNIAVNGAAGAVTFDIVSDISSFEIGLTGQTGYTITS